MNILIDFRPTLTYILITFYDIQKKTLWHFTCLKWFINYYMFIFTCLDNCGLKFVSLSFNLKSNNVLIIYPIVSQYLLSRSLSLPEVIQPAKNTDQNFSIFSLAFVIIHEYQSLIIFFTQLHCFRRSNITTIFMFYVYLLHP